MRIGPFSAPAMLELMIVFALALVPSWAAPPPPKTIGFSGVVTDAAGKRLNGPLVVKLSVYLTPSLGAALWSDTKTVTAANGLFTTVLGDTPGDPFPPAMDFGNAYYVGLAAGPDAAHLDPEMTPRLPLQSVPYAEMAYSLPVDPALLAKVSGGAMTSNGTSVGIGTLPSSARLDVAGDVKLSAAGAGIAFPDGSRQGTAAVHPARIVTVAASGGDFTTIQAAVDSIADATDIRRYVVRIAPGTYNERVHMKPYVDLEGSGELTTKITYPATDLTTMGTVVAGGDAELRFLTVEVTGTYIYGAAIWLDNVTSMRLTHVTAEGHSDQKSGGVYLTNKAQVVMDECTCLSTGLDGFALYMEVASTVTARNCVFSSKSDAFRNNGGIANVATSELDGYIAGTVNKVGCYNGSFAPL